MKIKIEIKIEIDIYIYMSYMLHIYTLFFLLWQPSSNCNVSSFQKVHGVWTGGLLQVSTKTTIKTSENTRKSSDFQGKLDLQMGGINEKNIRPPLMESLMLSKHEACAGIFQAQLSRLMPTMASKFTQHHHPHPQSPPISQFQHGKTDMRPFKVCCSSSSIGSEHWWPDYI